MSTYTVPLRGKTTQASGSRSRQATSESPGYGCEIMALVALTILSALSHFWYILIAICIAAVLGGMSVAVFRMFVSARESRLRRNIASREIGTEAQTFIDASQGPG